MRFIPISVQRSFVRGAAVVLVATAANPSAAPLNARRLKLRSTRRSWTLLRSEAPRDDRFTWALGKIWIVAKGLPPDVVERIVIASGNAIRPA